MPDVGIRELKTHASEIVRSVREERTRYVITYRGRPVGLLVPLDEIEHTIKATTDLGPSTAWDDLSRLGEEIGRGWRVDQTSTELLSSMRR